jgi:hypothetical protein
MRADWTGTRGFRLVRIASTKSLVDVNLDALLKIKGKQFVFGGLDDRSMSPTNPQCSGSTWRRECHGSNSLPLPRSRS